MHLHGRWRNNRCSRPSLDMSTVTPILALIEIGRNQADQSMPSLDKRTVPTHRSSCLGRAMERMQAQALKELRNEAARKLAAGEIVPPPAAEPAHQPEKSGWFRRVFSGNKPEPQKIKASPLQRKALENQQEAEATGVPVKTSLLRTEVSADAVVCHYDNGLILHLPHKSATGLETLKVLQEFEAVGAVNTDAIGALSKSLERPIFKLTPRSAAPAQRRSGAKVGPQDFRTTALYDHTKRAKAARLPVSDPVVARKTDPVPRPEPSSAVPVKSRPLVAPRAVDVGAVEAEVDLDRLADAANDERQMIELGETPAQLPLAEEEGAGDEDDGLGAGAARTPVHEPKPGRGEDPQSQDTASAATEPALEHQSSPHKAPTSRQAAALTRARDTSATAAQSSPTEKTPAAPWWTTEACLIAAVRVECDAAARSVLSIIGADKPGLAGEVRLASDDAAALKWIAQNRTGRLLVRFRFQPNAAHDPDLPAVELTAVGIEEPGCNRQRLNWNACKEGFKEAQKKVEAPSVTEARKEGIVAAGLSTGVVPGTHTVDPTSLGSAPASLAMPKLRRVIPPKANPAEPEIPGI